ncbi:MAG: histidine--tRNA ligase [Candidatus Aenigmarchaeota archaeon]|nr:histidine--tRNA ligase [Candidatus Aenigmarchaeota archaeon]
MEFQPLKGMKDFLPEEMVKRQYVIATVEKVFERYGFDPFETPVIEDWKLLSTKSGEDLAKQIFKFEDKNGKEVGLRAELTPSLARVIVNNPQLPKPFKRYAIAPVWRYEEPQSGRRRQFWQADVDTVGSNSMTADAECIACAVDCLSTLGFKDFSVKLNNRKILNGILEAVGVDETKRTAALRAIDKLEKVGTEEVMKELERDGLDNKQVKRMLSFITTKGKKRVRSLNALCEEGVKELEEILRIGKAFGISKFVKLDFSLARGLDYYTGPIFEIAVKSKTSVGSVAGGGRYDRMIELFGGVSTPATGISLGIERIVEIMKDEGMLGPERTKVKLFIANVDSTLLPEAVRIARKMRKKGIACQTDLMNRNLNKQLEYADSAGISYVVVVGERELKSGRFKLKDMAKKTEEEMPLARLAQKIKSAGRRVPRPKAENNISSKRNSFLEP